VRIHRYIAGRNMNDVTLTTADSARMKGAASGNAPPQQRLRVAYLAIAITIVVMVGWGFWRTYFGPLLHGGVNKYSIIHVHAAVFVGWLALLVTQAWLVVTGNLHLHRRLGKVGVAYGMLVICIGSIISIATPILHVQAHQMPVARASLVVLYNLTDIFVFSGFFVTAMIYQRIPELHRRLILSATVALLSAAIGRLRTGWLVYMLVWLSPVFASMAVDLWIRRRLYLVSLVSLAIFALSSYKVLIYSLSPLWQGVGHALIRPFL
jgi:hypothetical protein